MQVNVRKYDCLPGQVCVTIWLNSGIHTQNGMSLPQSLERYGTGFDWVRYHLSCFTHNFIHRSSVRKAVSTVRIYDGADLTSIPRSLKHIVEANK